MLTLIGLFPTLGSLVKGCLKILFAYGRKAVAKLGKNAATSDMWVPANLETFLNTANPVKPLRVEVYGTK